MNSLCGIALSMLVILLPGFVTVFLFFFQDRLDTPALQRFQSFYNCIRFDSRLALLFTPLFLMRRLIVVMAAVFMPVKSGYHCQFFIFLSIAMLAYLVFVRPFATRIMNILEIINEAVVLITGYHLILFSDYVADIDFKQKAGFSFIAILSACILLNWSFLFIQTVLTIFKSVKAKCQKRQQPAPSPV